MSFDRFKCYYCGEPFGVDNVHVCEKAGAPRDGGVVVGAAPGAHTLPTYVPRTEPSALAKQEGGDHYKDLKIQPIEYIHANGIPFAEGCVIKYVSRWRAKGGIKDLEKAKHFLELLIELEGRGDE